MATTKKKGIRRLPGAQKSDVNRKTADEAEARADVCGIVMPLSAIDNCNESHWADVREILNEAIEAAGFEPQLVSDADDVGIIQKRIIHNLYGNPIVVCDVSGKNPNVMFELGMRLAFDKPTVIVKDDKTTYSFDTAPIEHLEYPRDLRFGRIVEFKQSLAEKLQATHEKATSDSNYTTFLKHFGPFTVAKLETKTVSTDDFILEEMRSLRQMVARLGAKVLPEVREPSTIQSRVLCLRDRTATDDEIFMALAPFVGNTIEFLEKGNEHFHVPLPNLGTTRKQELLSVGRKLAKTAKILPVRP